MERIGIEELLFTAGTRLGDVHRRPDAPIGELPVEHELHVPGALELLENQLVHATPGVDQRRGDDRQRAPLLEHAGRREQLLRDVERLDVDAAAHRPARVPDPLVEGPSHARDRVHEQEDVLAGLRHPLAALDHQLREPNMALDIAVEATGDHVPLHRPPHVGDLLRPFVDEEHDERQFGVVGRHRLRHLLEEHGLARPRRGDDQRPLPLPQRRQQIHDPGGERLLAGLETEPMLRIDRGQLIEGLHLRVVVRRHPLDLDDLLDARPLLPPPWLDHRLDGHPLAEAVAFDHRAGNERVGPLTRVVCLDGTEESVAVGMHLQHTVAGLERNWFTVLTDLRLHLGRPHPLAIHADGTSPGDAPGATTATATATPTGAAAAPIATASAASAIASLAPLLAAASAVLLTARLPSLTEPGPWAALRP